MSNQDPIRLAVLERYYRELLNFCNRIIGNSDAAADAVQETYARVLSAQRKDRDVTEPRALLYRTARNLITDQHRRNVVRGQTTGSDAEPDADLVLDDLAAPLAFEPEAAAMSAQAVAAMLDVIRALPPRCRQAFVLHRFDGLSHAEIAERMDISRKMVEQHIKVAMLACRRGKSEWDLRAGERPSAAPSTEFLQP
ncbi:sigma-70 family RNA polymerase sigma factor [Achromobacter veterisilvae]|uniref:Sigma-70 family RNA polymerase sigma factor n=1 Tax=Achromobacter veterisilvae TaxID=2069367 RepID=A0ABZ2RZE3_9BURK|nr:sigma-70 family RNA polymerase sigma factor [Achromobacter sp.]MCW0211093.1 sigma-70 family RNA polymerase sigma factor [Achromobacter sp.]